MIFCFDGAIVVHIPEYKIVHFAVIGIIWNVVFVLFYHKIFKVK